MTSNLIINDSFEDYTGALQAPWTSSSSGFAGSTSSATVVTTPTPPAGANAIKLSHSSPTTQAGQYFRVIQRIYTGFVIGARLTVGYYLYKSNANSANNPLIPYFRVYALNSAGALISEILTNSNDGTTGYLAWTWRDAVSSAVPANTASLQFILEINHSQTTGLSLTQDAYFDALYAAVVPGVVTGSSQGGSTHAGSTHDISLTYDEDIGPVGFNILRDQSNKLGYFQEEAPVFGDPKATADSSASDFTLWRSESQLSFAEGMGQVDFDKENGAKRVLLIKNGLLTDTGAIQRASKLTTNTIAPNITGVGNYPSVWSTTSFAPASSTTRYFLARGTQLMYTDSITGAFAEANALPQTVRHMITYKRDLYIAYGNSGVSQRKLYSDGTLNNLADNVLFFGSGEGVLIRVTRDANSVYSVLSSSTDGITWANTTTISDGVFDVTGVLANGFFQGLFYFGLPSGLYTWDGTTSPGNIIEVIGFGTASDTINCSVIQVWQGKLYFNIGKGFVYEFDGASAPTLIFDPWSTDIISKFGGVFTATIERIMMASTTWRLYVALQIYDYTSGTVKKTLLYAFDGHGWVIEKELTGWHELAVFMGQPYLYIVDRDAATMQYLKTDRSLEYSDQDRTGITEVRLSRQDFQRPLVNKLVSSVLIRYRDLTATADTTLATDTQVGDTAMTVASAASIVAGDWVVIDADGSTSEVKYVSSKASNTLTFGVPDSTTYGTTNTVAALEHPHDSGVTVHRIHLAVGCYDVASQTMTMIGGLYDASALDQVISLPDHDPFVSTKFELRMFWIGSSAINMTCTIKEIAIRYIYSPEPKKRFRWSIDLRSGIRRLGGVIEDRTTAQMVRQVWAAKAAQRLIEYHDIDGTSYFGRLGLPEIRYEEYEVQPGSGVKVLSATCTWSFIETDAELVK